MKFLEQRNEQLSIKTKRYLNKGKKQTKTKTHHGLSRRRILRRRSHKKHNRKIYRSRAVRKRRKQAQRRKVFGGRFQDISSEPNGKNIFMILFMDAIKELIAEQRSASLPDTSRQKKLECLEQYESFAQQLSSDKNLKYWVVKQLTEDKTSLSRCVIVVRMTDMCCMQLFTYRPQVPDKPDDVHIRDVRELQEVVETLAREEKFQYILAYPGPDEYYRPTYCNGLYLLNKGFRVVLPRAELLSCKYLIENKFFEKEAIRSRVFQGDELLEQFVTDELAVDLQNADDKLREKYWEDKSMKIIKELLKPANLDGTYDISFTGEKTAVLANIKSIDEYNRLFEMNALNNPLIKFREALLCKVLT